MAEPDTVVKVHHMVKARHGDVHEALKDGGGVVPAKKEDCKTV